MFFSLFRQREATKRDHVARSGQNKSDSLNCAAELASLKQSSHCLKAPFFNRRICYLPSRYRNVNSSSHPSSRGGEKQSSRPSDGSSLPCRGRVYPYPVKSDEKERLHPPPIWGGLGGGGCFFASFFAPKKERTKALLELFSREK